MATLPDIELSYGTDLSHELNVKRLPFGDKYTLRAADGENNHVQKWKLTWDSVSESEKDTLVDFLVGLGGTTAFEWTPFGQSEELSFITVSKIGERPKAFGLWTVTVDVEQVFDP